MGVENQDINNNISTKQNKYLLQGPNLNYDIKFHAKLLNFENIRCCIRFILPPPTHFRIKMRNSGEFDKDKS